MKEIRKKLRGKEGSSLIIAVIILLICTVLGGIVLSAASANMSRIKRNRDEQQAYLTAESAALMFRELLVDEKIKISVMEDGFLNVEAEKEDKFTDMLCGDIESLLAVPNKELEKQLELFGDGISGGQNVKVVYRMNAGYGVEISAEVTSDGEVLSKLFAEFPAVSQTQDGVTNLSWNKGTITRLEEVKEEEP